MSRVLRCAVLGCIILALGPIGCATQSPPEAPCPRPKPSNFEISGTLELNLTPQMSVETGLPQTLNATLEASAHAEVISTDPMHSQHEGKLKLIVTDASGKQTFANLNIHIAGESDGSPSEGLVKAMEHFFDAASLMSKPLPTGDRKLK